MNPFISFCLYVAARVFVQYLKSRPKDTQIRQSLQFLLTAMQALKRKNPLTESFLVQLDVDLEGAGLEDTISLQADARAQCPNPRNVPTHTDHCPPASEHLGGMGQGGGADYCDIDPNTYSSSNNVPLTTTAPTQTTISAFGYGDLDNFNADSNMGFISNAAQYDLPSRQRSPGSSHQSSKMYRSPNSFNPDMDTSPDGSGADNQTPNSSTQSQQNVSTHTSNTGYSPQNMQYQDQTTNGLHNGTGQYTGIFDPNDPSFSTDFNMHNYTGASMPNQQQGFVLPTNWTGGTATGLTPGPTGLTPGATGMTPGASGMGDMIGMTDADWNQIMDTMSYQQWESGTGGH